MTRSPGCKKLCSLILAILIVFGLCACRVQTPEQTEDTVQFREQSYPFHNTSSEYTIPDADLRAYYKQNGSVAYVDLMAFLQTLNGLLRTNELLVDISSENTTYSLSWLYIEDEETMKITGHEEPEQEWLTLQANWETESLTVSDLSFFSFTNETEDTDYGAYLELDDYVYEEGEAVTFPLAEYGFDLIYQDDVFYMPFSLANFFFCSLNMYNVYFNGEQFVGVWTHAEDDVLLDIKASALTGTDCPADIRQETWQFMCLVMDYFYGLKEYKNIERFADYVLPSVKESILSQNAQTYTDAYVKVFHEQLNDLHTNVSATSYYNRSADTVSPYDTEDTNSIWYRFYNAYISNYTAAAAAYSYPIVRVDDTVFVILEEFLTGADSEIYDEQGNETEDAYQYDTRIYLAQVMDVIKELDGVKNIVLDLSLNPGGNVGAAMTALGFMTDEPISVSTHNTLSGEYTTEYYLVDADADGDFFMDAYDSYAWYIKTSVVTFSAANMFTAVAKNMGIATVIGEMSGGGMCSVLFFVLPDGTGVRISSDDTLIVAQKTQDGMQYTKTENGIEPDITLQASELFDFQLIVDKIHNK